MADKVDYKKIQINFSDIMFKLHTVAMNNAKKAASGIQMDNTAFDDDGKFTGSAEHRIVMKPEDESVKLELKDKPTFLKYAQEYFKYFLGEDVADQVTKENLEVLLDPVVVRNQDNDQEKKDQQPEEQNKDNQTQEQPQTTSESLFISRLSRKIDESLEFLFEDKPQIVKKALDEEVKEKTKDPDPEAEEQTKSEIKGFGTFYAIDVFGTKRKSFGEICKRKAKGFFGGMMADLKNMEIVMQGGGSLKIGKLFDVDEWKNAAGYVDLDISEVDNQIKKVILNDYPTSTAYVRVYDKDSLYHELQRQNKLDIDIKNKIMSCPYSVTIEVISKDPAYKEFTKEKIAEICTRAFGTSLNLTNRNKVTADDVIQIDNYESLYNQKSVYDMPKRSSNSDTISEHKNLFMLKSNLVESLISMLFENEIIEEAGRHTAAHIAQQIDKYGSKNILLKKDLILQKLKEYYGNKSGQQIKQEMIPIFNDFFKLTDNESMKRFVNDRFGNNQTGNRTTQAFWKCLDGAGIPDAEPEQNNQTSISIDFMANNPSEENSQYSKLSTLVAEPGHFNQSVVKVPEYEGFEFKTWNPDPNSLSGNGQVSSIFENLKKDDEGNDEEEKKEEGKNYEEQEPITIRFMDKDPRKLRDSLKLVGELDAVPGHFHEISAEYPENKDSSYKNKYEGYVFSRWSTDPDELTDNSEISAVFTSLAADKHLEKRLFIIPHKALTSKNRTNDVETFDDGTTRQRPSKEPHKASDARM